MSDLWKDTLSGFISRVSSSDPVPGGGSASGVAGLIGLGLVQMSVNVTRGSVVDPGCQGRLDNAAGRLARIAATLSKLIEADMAAFASYMTAIKMPKHSEAEIADRNQALDLAMLASATVPLEAANSCADALAVAKSIEPDIKDSIISDLLSGAELLESAGRSTLLNVDVNVRSKRLANERDDLANKRNELSAVFESSRAHFLEVGRKRGFSVSRPF